MKIGHCVWAFPDGELPPRQPSAASLASPGVHGHESLVLLNTGDVDARVKLHVYFPDREPWVLALAPVPARRVACVRMDEPLGDEALRMPAGQYSLVLVSDRPVVAQFGRMDIRQPNLAYYTVMGFPCP